MAGYQWTIGERVAVTDRGRLVGAAVIKRITKTQVVLESGSRFRSDGSRVGWPIRDSMAIRPLTEEDKRKLAKRSLVSFLRDVKWESYSTDTLRGVREILKQATTDPTVDMSQPQAIILNNGDY